MESIPRTIAADLWISRCTVEMHLQWWFKGLLYYVASGCAVYEAIALVDEDSAYWLA